MKLKNVLRGLFKHITTSPSTNAQRLWNNALTFAYKVFNTPGGWASVSFLFLYLVLVRYCNHAYYRDPTSVFFDPQRGYERGYSVIRQEQGDRFIQTANTSRNIYRFDPPKLCIGIASVGRPGNQYVGSTVGSLLAGLTEQQRGEINLVMLIAHTNPWDHPIYGQAWLEVVANKVLLYHVSEEQTKQLQTWEEEKDYRKKAVFDYTYLLDYCHATGASWIAMVEDDTLAMAGWYPKAMDAVETADAQRRWSKTSDWLYLRLFYTEEFFGWNVEEWPCYLLASVAIFSATAASLLGIRTLGLQKLISNHVIIVVCLFYTPACIILYFLAGPVSMVPLSPSVQQMPKFGCCAQGLVFSREMAPKVVARLTIKKAGYVDMLVEEWADEEDLVRWAVVPSLLQHIGGRSSKGDDMGFKSKHNRAVAEKIWNFGFELHKADDT